MFFTNSCPFEREINIKLIKYLIVNFYVIYIYILCNRIDGKYSQSFFFYWILVQWMFWLQFMRIRIAHSIHVGPLYIIIYNIFWAFALYTVFANALDEIIYSQNKCYYFKGHRGNLFYPDNISPGRLHKAENRSLAITYMLKSPYGHYQLELFICHCHMQRNWFQN